MRNFVNLSAITKNLTKIVKMIVNFRRMNGLSSRSWCLYKTKVIYLWFLLRSCCMVMNICINTQTYIKIYCSHMCTITQTYIKIILITYVHHLEGYVFSILCTPSFLAYLLASTSENIYMHAFTRTQSKASVEMVDFVWILENYQTRYYVSRFLF